LFDRRQQLQLQSGEPPWRSSRWCDDVVEKAWWCRNYAVRPSTFLLSVSKEKSAMTGNTGCRMQKTPRVRCARAAVQIRRISLKTWCMEFSRVIHHNRDMGHLRHHEYSIHGHHIRRYCWVVRRRCRPMRRMTLQDYAIHYCL
jgi:hypothetical protein